MEFIRLIISFLLMFILLHLSDCCSAAHTHQDMKKNVAADREMSGIEAVRRSSQNVEQVFEDGVPSTDEVDKTTLRERKMMSEKSIGKGTAKNMGKKIAKEEVSTISRSVHSVGHRNSRRKGILNVGCKPRNRKPPTYRKVKMAGFTAFSADYRVPKSHPPKNN